jgi:hypothetical protein
LRKLRFCHQGKGGLLVVTGTVVSAKIGGWYGPVRGKFFKVSERPGNLVETPNRAEASFYGIAKRQLRRINAF